MSCYAAPKICSGVHAMLVLAIASGVPRQATQTSPYSRHAWATDVPSLLNPPEPPGHVCRVTRNQTYGLPPAAVTASAGPTPASTSGQGYALLATATPNAPNGAAAASPTISG